MCTLSIILLFCIVLHKVTLQVLPRRWTGSGQASRCLELAFLERQQQQTNFVSCLPKSVEKPLSPRAEFGADGSGMGFLVTCSSSAGFLGVLCLTDFSLAQVLAVCLFVLFRFSTLVRPLLLASGIQESSECYWVCTSVGSFSNWLLCSPGW